MRIVTLVPWRTAPDREPLWEHVRAWLEQLGFPIITGDSDTELFSISRAFNAAAEAAGDWDLAVLSEADVWVGHDQVHQAVEADQDIVWCYDAHVRLDAMETRLFLGNGSLPDRPGEPAQSRLGSNGVRVVSRYLWDLVGGYDPAFIGWGAEDNDFAYRVLHKFPEVRIPGTMYELAHERDADYFAARSQNRAILRERYG